MPLFSVLPLSAKSISSLSAQKKLQALLHKNKETEQGIDRRILAIDLLQIYLSMRMLG